MSWNKWEKVEEQNAYLGDLKDPYGRRILLIVTGGVAVFAKCTVEDYLVMKDDFDKLLTDFEFTLAGKVENGVPVFSRELEGMFHSDELEEITRYLYRTLT